MLDKYKNEICSFNDDIQGTASVALAAILSALKSIDAHLRDQKIVIVGGGSAGLGIAGLLIQFMMNEGLTEEEARARFYVIDAKGLLCAGSDFAHPLQRSYAKSKEEIKHFKVENPSHITLLETVENVAPTILLGLSGQPKLFTETIVKTLCSKVKRPIIFPLSNPTSRSEATPEDLIDWSKGDAIVATGSPSKKIEYQGKKVPIAQCNNVYIFPGVGLGVISVKSSVVTDEMFLIAADVLSSLSPKLTDPNGCIFPKISELREVSKQIAYAVAAYCIEKGYAKVEGERAQELVDQAIWYPNYPKIQRKGSF